MRDNVITFRKDEVIFVFQAVRQRADQVEQAVAAGCDVRTMLDVAIGPEMLGGGIVPLVEECVEGFEYERLVLFWGVVLDMRLVLAVKASSHHRRGWCCP